MQLLLNDKYAPITSEIGFLETDTFVAAQAFLEWQRPIQAEREVSLILESISSSSLEELLQKLLPLTSVERRRFLFVPTTSTWTAYFDNGYRGTDAVSTISFLAQQMKCRGLRVVAIPDTIQGTSNQRRGRYGAMVLELYGPDKTDFLNYIRSIGVIHDGDRWVFDQGGTPLPFEHTEYYKARSIKQRFTFDILQEYLKHLGLSPFEEDFYLPPPNNRAAFVRKEGPANPDLQEYTLQQVKDNF